MPRTQRRIACFEINDFLLKDRIDPEIGVKLEEALMKKGSIAMSSNVTTNEVFVFLEDPAVNAADLVPVFANFGLRAHIKGEGP